MIPWGWNILTYNNYTLIVFIFGSWSALCLHTIEIKGVEDETASKLEHIIITVLVVGIITIALLEIRSGKIFGDEYKAKVAVEKALAKEPVLAIIAKCRPAKEFDSLEKIEAADKLYEEKGLLPWQDNIGCWESRITRDMLPVKLAIVEEPTKNWGQVVKNPHIANAFVDWPSAGEECEIKPDGDESRKLPCQKATFTLALKYFQFHSTGKETGKVEVIIRQ